ncbi:ras-related protein Rab-32 [Takifugu rubripes]|uniref:ras-related protein Rab-32 n=1 Tax=Takifugu rubripes TaxID=31033 RepID=UPI000298B4AC|nr:ras-related protein Rab-32-like [Takifugu rubripes]|eukprot:XP_003978587.1 PREDICTED: ras-related protein Rab-32-like [Takifugu rubripes]
MTEASSASWKEKLFKVLVIGDLGVGKSSVILQYVKKCFMEKYKASIGVDFALKTIEWDPQTLVRLQFWDIAGQERFRKMSRVYYKGAMGALVVFDITNSSTLEAASEWKEDLDSKVCLHSGHLLPAVLLANKCDGEGRDRGDPSWLDGFCEKNGFSGWFETSAKDNINIDEAVHFLVQQMMLLDGGLSGEEEQRDRIPMRRASEDGPRREVCC